ncbi:MAG: (2Fe-2S)-binding protein [Clostridia bacterium]|nr:(2Fe-2S)-binding protein [Clostridia bacterium]
MGITLTINGIRTSVEPGTTVLEAAQELGIRIPTLCHDPALSSFSACRMCVVEVAGMRNLPAACALEAAEGMVVETESPAVVEARRTILELLLASHPADCLTCDKSGECLLQDYAYQYQVRGGNLSGEVHDFPLDDTNPYIVRDNNKCILCGKCVRACAEIRGLHILNFSNRGFNTKVTTAFDEPLADSDCVFCQACVAVCPVGALMSRELVGRGRRWEMQKEEVTCTFCDSGCRFWVYRRKTPAGKGGQQFNAAGATGGAGGAGAAASAGAAGIAGATGTKSGPVVAVVPKSPGPGRPLCLKGRLGLELIYNPEVPARPVVRKDGQLVEVSWEEALGLAPLLDRLLSRPGAI